MTDENKLRIGDYTITRTMAMGILGFAEGLLMDPLVNGFNFRSQNGDLMDRFTWMMISGVRVMIPNVIAGLYGSAGRAISDELADTYNYESGTKFAIQSAINAVPTAVVLGPATYYVRKAISRGLVQGTLGSSRQQARYRDMFYNIWTNPTVTQLQPGALAGNNPMAIYAQFLASPIGAMATVGGSVLINSVIVDAVDVFAF